VGKLLGPVRLEGMTTRKVRTFPDFDDPIDCDFVVYKAEWSAKQQNDQEWSRIGGKRGTASSIALLPRLLIRWLNGKGPEQYEGSRRAI